MSASVCSRRSRLDLAGPPSPSKRSYGSSPVSPETMAKRRSVCRALFVSPSESRADNYAKNKLREMQIADSIKYNFDFDNLVPLPGRWKWEPCPESSSSSENSTVPKTPRVLPKPTIFTAPFAYTQEELMELGRAPCIVEDVDYSEPEPLPTIPEAQSSRSKSNQIANEVEEPLIAPPPGSQEKAEDIPTIPSPSRPAVTVSPAPPALEAPKASTSPLKRERNPTVVIKQQPKMKQQRLTNTYFKETKRPNRRVRAGTGKKKSRKPAARSTRPARPARPSV